MRSMSNSFVNLGTIIAISLVAVLTDRVCEGADVIKTSFSTLHVFHREIDKSEGSYPGELTLGKDGYLYGVTSGGGVSNAGTIFRISTSGDFKTLHQFLGPDGLNPYGCVLPGADGSLYGSTNQFGPRTTTFRITPSGEFRTVYVFPESDEDGLSVRVRGIDGRIYSMKRGTGFDLFEGRDAGYGKPDIDIVAAAGSAPQPQSKLTETNSASLCPGGVITADGAVFGGFRGLMRRVSTKATDPNWNYASGAVGPLAIDDDGNIFATTTWSGGNEFGIVEVSNKGVASLAYSLKTLPGLGGSVRPRIGLIRSQNDYFYGIVQGDYNAIYRFRPGNEIEVVYVAPSGTAPVRFNGLVVDSSDGAIYGTYSQYYDAHDGAIFRLIVKP